MMAKEIRLSHSYAIVTVAVLKARYRTAFYIIAELRWYGLSLHLTQSIEGASVGLEVVYEIL